MTDPWAKRQALERAVSPPMVCQSGSQPLSIKSQKISMLPTAATQCSAVRPFRSRIFTLGLLARMALARLVEEMEAESMRRVCPAGVRGVLRRGRTWLRKACAVCGEHWFICMHWSQTLMGAPVPDGAARWWPACAYYKLQELSTGATAIRTPASTAARGGGNSPHLPSFIIKTQHTLSPLITLSELFLSQMAYVQKDDKSDISGSNKAEDKIQ